MGFNGVHSDQNRTFKVISLIIIFICVLVFNVPAAADQPPHEQLEAAGEEGLLMFFESEDILTTSATLTESAKRYVPSAMTVITKEMILSSGARRLDDLLEIYVPNFQTIRHFFQGVHAGLRGIISDNDDRFLLLVNGRILNLRTAMGAISERDLVMLDDIHHIDIVRGPGSAIYGPGAVAMVINIITETANTFQGSKLTTKVGFIEEFYSVEYKHGTMLDDETGLFLYAGIADYRGANKKHAPMVYGGDFTTTGSVDTSVEQGEPAEFSMNRDREAYRNLPKLKFHGEITKENFNFWIRYTRGGDQYGWSQYMVADIPHGWAKILMPEITQPARAYQQLTAYAGYQQQISDTLDIEYVFSYDLFDLENPKHNKDNKFGLGKGWWFSYREDEYLFRILGKWNPNENHSVAVGVEKSWEIFGFKSPGYPHEHSAISSYKSDTMPHWSTNTNSIFGEYQWTHNDRWRTFWGMRIDKNSYSEELKSPRAAVIFTPNEKDTYKFMLSRSVRASSAIRMRESKVNSLGRARPEKLDSYEFRYERQHTDNLWLGASVFYDELEAIGWGGVGIGQRVVGTQEFWGAELEALYSTDKWQVQLSHSYVHLVDFELESQDISQVLTADPYGHGEDLAMWSNHITKLYAKYTIDPKYSADASLVAYWGFPGAEDMAKYQETLWIADGYEVARDPDYDDPWGPSIFLSMGLEYKPSDDLALRFDAYNLLGWIDNEYNKKIFIGASSSTYRSSAPAFGVSLRYKF